MRGDGLLNGAELQAALPQQIDAPAHEFVIIRLIASGAAQLGNAAFLGKGDPDLGDEDALHVQTNDIHRERFLSFLFQHVGQHIVQHGVLVDDVGMEDRAALQAAEILGMSMPVRAWSCSIMANSSSPDASPRACSTAAGNL